MIIPAGFTVDSYTLEPAIPGVSYSAGNLLISSMAAPFAKGITKESLTLTLRLASGMNGATITASLTFDLRLEAPTPRLLTTAGPFEVNVGEDYTLQLLTDVSTFCPNQNIAIVGTLPVGLVNNSARLRKTGLITGKNTSTTLPWEFPVNVVVDTSTFYEGGGTLTVPVIFRLRNLNAPIITSRNRCIGGINRTMEYEIKAENQPIPSRFEFIGNLPPGLTVAGPLGQTIKGKPTTPGNYPLVLKAYNERRPGSTDPLDKQAGIADLILVISGSGPAVSTPVASINNMTIGMIHNKTPFITTDGGMRLFAIGLPTGLTLNEHDGTLSGTNTASGIFNVTLYLMNGSGWTIKKTTLNVK